MQQLLSRLWICVLNMRKPFIINEAARPPAMIRVIGWRGRGGEQEYSWARKREKDEWVNISLWKCQCGEKGWAHLSLLLRRFEEKSVDDSNSVSLDVLISPGIRRKQADYSLNP